jgi:hypothetical protein
VVSGLAELLYVIANVLFDRFDSAPFVIYDQILFYGLCFRIFRNFQLLLAALNYFPKQIFLPFSKNGPRSYGPELALMHEPARCPNRSGGQ